MVQTMNILFFGDSITDSGRDREDPSDIGHGYPMFSSRMISERFPDVKFTFFNRGIGGNRTGHLVNRLESDLIALSPDITVIMIGVNDVWCRYSTGDIVSNELFESNLLKILETARSVGSSVVLLEPYLLPNEKYLPAFADLDEKIRIVRALAREHADAFVATHGAFAELLVKHDWSELSSDGVHPNELGARFIASKATDALIPIIEAKIAK